MARFDALASTTLESLGIGIFLGIALTVAVAFALRVFAPLNAATRALIWVATLVALPLLAPLYFASHAVSLAGPSPQLPVSRPSPPSIGHASIQVQAPVRGQATQLRISPATSAPVPQRLNITLPENFAAALLSIYAAVAGLLLLRLLISYFRLRLLRRRTEAAPADLMGRLEHWLSRCPTDRKIELRLSHCIRSPLAIGFLCPVIVMPAALALELSEQEYDDLGVHELAHLRRHDDWTNLLQRLLEAVFFFQPAVHYIGRKLKLERELACDDWVVAAHEGKSYARCLAKIVELRRYQHDSLVLSSGAFFGKRQIVKRIEALLDKTRNAATGISVLTVALIVIAMIGIAAEVLQLPELVAFTEEQSGTTSTRVSDGSRDLRIKLKGELNFSPDEQTIASVSPGGFLMVDERRGWVHRRLEVRSGNSGAPEQKYFLDGREKPMDGVGRAWAADTYLFVLRELGVDAEGRLTRLLSRRGPAGVLEEVDLIHSDHIKCEYLARLLEQATLSAGEIERVNDSARKISSDNDKADFLIAHRQELLTDHSRQSYFRAVNSLHSDNDHRRVLVHLLETESSDPETTRMIAASAKQINSDSDKADVLLAIPSKASAETGCAMLAAARNIQSDSDKARVLQTSAFNESADCRSAWFAVANQINSDNDRAAVLQKLMESASFAPETYREIANSAKRIQSDGDKANVLAPLSTHYTDTPLFEAANTINSSNDRSRVLKAVLEHSPSSVAKLDTIKSALAMSDDNERAALLVAIAKQSNEPEVRSALQTACQTLSSDNQYRRVASAIFEHSEHTEAAP